MEALEEGWGWGWVGDSFSSKDGFFFFFLRALFSNLYMRTLAPGRRQKAAKVRPDLRMKDALLIKLWWAAAVREGMLEGDWAATQTRNTGGHRRWVTCIYTHTKKGTAHSATHKESLWHLVRVSAGKYLPTGIITEPLAVWPHREPN